MPADPCQVSNHTWKLTQKEVELAIIFDSIRGSRRKTGRALANLVVTRGVLTRDSEATITTRTNRISVPISLERLEVRFTTEKEGEPFVVSHVERGQPGHRDRPRIFESCDDINAIKNLQRK